MIKIEQANELALLMNSWESKHKDKGYSRFIKDGIVCEHQWIAQKTPRICFFLKEAYSANENGYNLTETLHNSNPWTMWKKVAIWAQAIHNAFDGISEYNETELRSNEKEVIDSISVVNVKKSNGERNSDYDNLKKFALEDKIELKRELEIIKPDIIVCGNNINLLKIVLENELENTDAWDTLIALWGKSLVINYYHPAVHYPNRVNYYALTSICHIAINKYGLSYDHLTERK